MKKLISLCVSISLLISFSAPLQAKGHSSKGKSSSSASSSKKRSSTPKQTTSSKNSCPADGIKDSTVQSMLKNPNGADWKDYNKMEKMSDFVEKHPEYKTTCRSQLIKGVNTATRFCSTYVQTAVEKDPTKIKFCGKDSPWSKLYDIMVAVGVQSGLASVYNFNPNTQQYEMQTGNGSSQDGVDKNKNVGRNSNQGPGENGQGGNRNAKDNQTSRLLLNLTQEEYDKLRQASADELPDTFKRLADILKEAISRGEDISKFIASIAKDSSLEPGSRNYVPFQFIQMAFLMYASTLKPNEAHKIMQYISNSRKEIRYAVASAVAEYSESSIGRNGGVVLNANPAGHLKLSGSDRAAAANQLQKSIDSYEKDCTGKRLDQVRLFRLYQDEKLYKELVKYTDDPSCSLASVGTTLVTIISSPEAAMATGVVLTGGIMFVAINDAYSQGYRDNFVSNLFSLLPSKEKMETILDLTCAMTTAMVNDAINSAQQNLDSDEDAKGGNRMLAVPVRWSQSYAQIGSSAQTATNQPRIDCGDTGRSDSNEDWSGRQWWRDRFPDGDSGAKMRTLVPKLRQEINALGGNVTKTSSARAFITQGSAFRSKLSKEAQMTLRELEEVHKNVISRSNSFYNTAARGNQDAAFVKAVKVNGKWKPSVEIVTDTSGISQVVNEVLSPGAITALKTVVCAGSGVTRVNLGGGILRFGSYDVDAPNPHMHYETDKGTYECNNAVRFHGAWNALVTALCSM